MAGGGWSRPGALESWRPGALLEAAARLDSGTRKGARCKLVLSFVVVMRAIRQAILQWRRFGRPGVSPRLAASRPANPN